MAGRTYSSASGGSYAYNTPIGRSNSSSLRESPAYSTPTLDAIRQSRAVRVGHSPMSTRSASQAPPYTPLKVSSSPYSSPQVAEEAMPPSTPGSRIAQVSSSMLEARLAKLETAQEFTAAQVRRELQDMLEPRLVAIEQSFKEFKLDNQKTLDKYSLNVELLCTDLASKASKESGVCQKLIQVGLSELKEGHAELKHKTEVAVADHALKMDSAFKDLDVRVSRTLRETEGRLNDRISRADELQSAELRQNTLTVDRKYADVCVGLDNKLLNLGDSLGKRIDEVEAVGEAKNETMEKRLQTFEARFLKSIAVTEKGLSAAIEEAQRLMTKEVDAARDAAAQDVHGTEGRLSASLAELETRLLAECRVLDEKRDESLVTARSYADEQASAAVATGSAALAETDQRLGVELKASVEKLYLAIQEESSRLQNNHVAPLSEKVAKLDNALSALDQRNASMEDTLNGCMSKLEYKMGKTMQDMRFDEIVGGVTQINEMLQEMDPTEKVIEFEGRMRDLELDMTLCTATVDAVS